MKLTPPGMLPTIALDHPDQRVGTALLMEAIGTDDPDFLRGLVEQLVDASAQCNQTSESGVNFMLSVIKSIQPRDPFETMLAAQLVGVHMACMRDVRGLRHGEATGARGSARRRPNGLIRDFVMLMDALKRHRSGCEPQVFAKNASAQDRELAIVSNVTHS